MYIKRVINNNEFDVYWKISANIVFACWACDVSRAYFRKFTLTENYENARRVNFPKTIKPSAYAPDF